jgi:t-SNARE complex subunit (syntaxin)
MHRTPGGLHAELTYAPVVNPDATTEEIKAIINDDQGGQLFAVFEILESQVP